MDRLEFWVLGEDQRHPFACANVRGLHQTIDQSLLIGVIGVRARCAEANCMTNVATDYPHKRVDLFDLKVSAVKVSAVLCSKCPGPLIIERLPRICRGDQAANCEP